MSHYRSRRHRSQLAKGVRARREERFDRPSQRSSGASSYSMTTIQRVAGDDSSWMTVPNKGTMRPSNDW